MTDVDPRTLQQGSPEWRIARLGKLTASRVHDAFAKTRSGWGASRSNYRSELICERISGIPYEGYSNWFIERGNKVEPEAIAAYEFIVGLEVQEVGFVPHPSIADAGASPDRLVGADGILEAKCRTTAIHFELLLTHTIPGKFIDQVQFGLGCTDRSWCDFISYDPRAPAGFDLFVKRIYRDDKRISELELDGVEFLSEVQEHTQRLRERALTGFVFTSGDGDLTERLAESVTVLKSKKKDVFRSKSR